MTTKKKPIADDREGLWGSRRAGGVEGLLCERASAFSGDVDMADRAHLSALARMLERTMKTIAAMPDKKRAPPEHGSRRFEIATAAEPICKL